VVSVDGRKRGTLRPGDYLGEAALIVTELPRTATVTAKTDLRLGTMTAWEFRPLVEGNAKVAWSMLETLARRVADTPGA
jgi:CRP-like cAMP-binding protein